MPTTFTRLNEDWNAEPNGQQPGIAVEANDLVFEFLLNDLLYPRLKTAEKGRLRFHHCWRYRLGPTNDEGWYRGQCRFSRLEPKWGEFYEVHGDLLLEELPLQWEVIGKLTEPSRHFLFYLRDQTLECNAMGWEFSANWRA